MSRTSWMQGGPHERRGTNGQGGWSFFLASHAAARNLQDVGSLWAASAQSEASPPSLAAIPTSNACSGSSCATWQGRRWPKAA